MTDENNDIKQSPYDTLALSGGGVKGMITLGALQCAMDSGVISNISNYVGTSAGSIICYLLAIGYTPVEIIVYICTHRIVEKMYSFNLVAMLNGDGAISYQPVQETLEKMSIDKIGYFPTLKDIYEKYGKKLVCTTYNLTRNTLEYLSVDNYPDLPCLIAVRMSSNIPLVFEKFRYMGFEYVDGGIGDNFPIMEAEKVGNKVLGLVLMSNLKSSAKRGGFLQDTLRLMYVPIQQSTVYRISLTTEKTDCVKLAIDKLDILDLDLNSSQKLDMFSSGYQQMKKYLKNEYEVNGME